MTKTDLVAKMGEHNAFVPGKRIKLDFGGSEGAIASRRSLTAWATVRLFSPASMRAVPITTSAPFSCAAPSRTPPTTTWNSTFRWA